MPAGYDIDDMRHACASSLRNMFMYCSHTEGLEPPPFVEQVADFLQGTAPRLTTDIKMILGARYTIKTTLLRWYILWRWLRVPETRVLIYSSTFPLAKKMGEALRDAARKFEIFQDIAPAADACVSEFNLRGIKHEIGSSLKAVGIQTSVTSSRPDLIILDDPEPDDDAESEVLRQRIIEVVRESISLVAAPGMHLRDLGEVPPAEQTQIVIVGQPHTEITAYLPDPDDPVDQAEHPLRDVLTLRIPFLRRDGSWAWPDHPRWFNHAENRMFTTDEVINKVTPRRFKLQFQLDTTPPDGMRAVIDLGAIKIQHCRVAHPILVIDPADSDDGCETGVACGGTVGNRIHVQQLTGIRGETYEGDDEDYGGGLIGESVWAQIFNIAEEMDVASIHIEKNYKAAISAAHRYMSKAGRWMTIEEFAATGRKEVRIVNSLEQPINNGMVSAEPDVMQDPENRWQLARIRYDTLPKRNDRIDALAKMVSILIESPELRRHDEVDPKSWVEQPEGISVSTMRDQSAVGPLARRF